MSQELTGINPSEWPILWCPICTSYSGILELYSSNQNYWVSYSPFTGILELAGSNRINYLVSLMYTFYWSTRDCQGMDLPETILTGPSGLLETARELIFLQQL